VLVGVDAVGSLRIDWLGREFLGPDTDDFGRVKFLEGAQHSATETGGV
jgi:hypothetical protein